MSEEKKRCKALCRREGHVGQPCKNLAVEESDYCKFHGGGSVGKSKPGSGQNSPVCRSGHAPKGNTNSRKHGAYSARLMPDEQEVYEQVKAQFEEELGTDNLSASDQRLIHQLAVFSAKFDCASGKDAPGEALQVLSRQVMEHLRELKATRASKDSGALIGNTPADVMAALFLKVTGGQQPDPVAAAIPVEAKVVEALPADSADPQDPEA